MKTYNSENNLLLNVLGALFVAALVTLLFVLIVPIMGLLAWLFLETFNFLNQHLSNPTETNQSFPIVDDQAITGEIASLFQPEAATLVMMPLLLILLTFWHQIFKHALSDPQTVVLSGCLIASVGSVISVPWIIEALYYPPTSLLTQAIPFVVIGSLIGGLVASLNLWDIFENKRKLKKLRAMMVSSSNPDVRRLAFLLYNQDHTQSLQMHKPVSDEWLLEVNNTKLLPTVVLNALISEHALIISGKPTITIGRAINWLEKTAQYEDEPGTLDPIERIKNRVARG